MSADLTSYCKEVARAWEAWPPLPLADQPELAWWEALVAGSAGEVLKGEPLLQALEGAIPQLRLAQVQGISASELYKALVLRS